MPTWQSKMANDTIAPNETFIQAQTEEQVYQNLTGSNLTVPDPNLEMIMIQDLL